MKDKNFLFTISLTVTLFLLVVLSCFIENTIIENISQAIGVPLLLFTFTSFAFSVKDSIAQEYNMRAKLEREKLNTQIHNKAHYQLTLKVLKEIDSSKIVLDSSIEQNIEEINKEMGKIDEKSSSICQDIAFFEQIEREMNNNKIIPIVYTLSLCFLLISLVLPQLIAPIFSCVKSSTLTLISFLFPVLEIVIKEPLSNVIVNHKIAIYKERIKKAENKK